MPNNPNAVNNLKPFRKSDPRINRRGRPKSFDALRGLTLEIFTRPAKDSIGDPIIIEGKPVTIIEFVMWKMIHSKDPREIQYAVQVGYGKVPDKIELSGIDGGRIKIEAYDYNNAIAVITSGNIITDPSENSDVP